MSYYENGNIVRIDNSVDDKMDELLKVGSLLSM